MKAAWNTSTLPADLDWHAHNKPFRAYEMGASDPLDWPVIDYRPSDLARLGKAAPSRMPKRIQQKRDADRVVAVVSLLCLVAFGVIVKLWG